MSLDFVLFGSLYTLRRNALFFTVCWFDFSVFLLLILSESGTIQFIFLLSLALGFVCGCAMGRPGEFGQTLPTWVFHGYWNWKFL